MPNEQLTFDVEANDNASDVLKKVDREVGQAGDRIMTCVSRALSDRLVLDI